MKQFKGVEAGKPLRTNPIQTGLEQANSRAGDPADEQQRVSYGIITEVNEEVNRVKVDLFDRGNSKTRIGSGVDRPEGSFIPVMQPLIVIHHLYGALRKGLIVRVWWRGKQEPGAEAIAEIISDQDSSIFGSGTKSSRSNELATTPHEIFTGGLGF